MPKHSSKKLCNMLRKKKTKKKDRKSSIQGLSTGITVLNMALTGTPNVGLLDGHYYLLVGDSQAGKTWVSHNIMAEASINPKYDNYRLIYDDAEGGALMDLETYFGKRLAERIEPAHGTKSDPKGSETVEQSYDAIEDAIDEGIPFIFIQDSNDVLDTEADAKKTSTMRKKRKEGKQGEEAGTYGTAKAKTNSTRLRTLMAGLKKTKSILIIISQTRDNLGFGFETKTRSGGRALRFYATLEMWLSIKGYIKKSVKGKERIIGTISEVRVKKNRIQGKNRKVHFPIYQSFGIDDIGGNIKWLIEEKHWSKTKRGVVAPEFAFKGKEEDLIIQIEEENEERKLAKLVRDVWNEIEEKCQVKRKKRY